MKKFILIVTFLISLATVITSCDPIEEINKTTEEKSITYLETSDEYPIDSSSSIKGYIKKTDDFSIALDEIKWETKETETQTGLPSGFRIVNESKETIDYTLSDDCQFWILDNHWQPCCRISFEDFINYNKASTYDIVWNIAENNGEVTFICEQYVP